VGVYRILNTDGTVNVAFTTTNVAETSVPGNYVVTGGISLPGGTGSNADNHYNAALGITPAIHIDNLNLLYIIADNSGDELTWIGFR
jgi:hypothetical protein